MTKIILIIFILFVTSCKKDYICNCYSYDVPAGNPFLYYREIYNTTIKDAKAKCNELSKKNNQNGNDCKLQ